MNMLREQEPFCLRGSTAATPVPMQLFTSSGGAEELVCILKQISLPLTTNNLFFSRRVKIQ